jgi:hypothetical protein
VFDPEKKKTAYKTQRHYKIFKKLPINFAKIFQTTFVIQHLLTLKDISAFHIFFICQHFVKNIIPH